MRSAAESYATAMFTSVPAGAPAGLMFAQSDPVSGIGAASTRTAVCEAAAPDPSPASRVSERNTATVATRRTACMVPLRGGHSSPDYLLFGNSALVRRPRPAARTIGARAAGTGNIVLNNEGRIARHSGGRRMPVAAEALRKLLQEFNARTSAKMSAIVSRSGVPVAWVLPDDAQVDNFATMAATLLGALEVMYATMKRDAPNRVTVVADGGILTVHGVTGKMFFVAMTEKQTAAFGKAVADALSKAKGLLGEA